MEVTAKPKVQRFVGFDWEMNEVVQSVCMAHRLVAGSGAFGCAMYLLGFTHIHTHAHTHTHTHTNAHRVSVSATVDINYHAIMVISQDQPEFHSDRFSKC